jgi:hypothetical protein
MTKVEESREMSELSTSLGRAGQYHLRKQMDRPLKFVSPRIEFLTPPADAGGTDSRL